MDPSPTPRHAAGSHGHVVAILGRGLVPADEPVITADDLGFTRGDGCFDSMRVLINLVGAGAPIDLDAHLDRMAGSAAALAITPPTHEQWRELVELALSAWPHPGEATVRLVLTRGREWQPGIPTALVTVSAISRAAIGTGPAGAISAITLSRGHPSDAFRDAPWLLGGVKTLSYVVNVAAKRVAAERGADDVIFTTTDGYALDGPTSGLLVARGGRLLSTPTGDTGILASTSVTRIVATAAAAGWPTGYELIPVAELFDAQGVWLVSSSRGPAPVTRLDGRDLAVDPDLVARVAQLAGF